MLKVICTFMALLIIFAVLCSNKVESRVVHVNLQGIPSSQLQYVRVANDQIIGESSNEDDAEGYIHTKRKSELLASLYGLPYSLVGKRKAN